MTHASTQEIRAALGKTFQGSGDEPDSSTLNVTSGEARKVTRPFIVPKTRYGPTESGRDILNAGDSRELVKTRQWLSVASGALKEANEELRQSRAVVDDLHREVERYAIIVYFIKERATELKRYEGDDSWEVSFKDDNGCGYVVGGQTLESCVRNALAKLEAMPDIGPQTLDCTVCGDPACEEWGFCQTELSEVVPDEADRDLTFPLRRSIQEAQKNRGA